MIEQIESALDIQPVLHLEDRLCPRLHNIQSKSKTNGLIELAFDNQPVLHRGIGCVEGCTFINQNEVNDASIVLNNLSTITQSSS